MRRLLAGRSLALVLAALSGPWAAAGEPWGVWNEVVAEHVLVLYQDRTLEPYAQRVAGRADAVLTELRRLFATDPPLVTITLDGNTDLYHAIAPPLPRPRVSLPALFPSLPEVDLRTSDPLYSLLAHELTHSVQLTYLEVPAGGFRLPRLGLLGETVAPLPPGWLLEGLAVWLADELANEAAQAGRSDSVVAARQLDDALPFDARTRGVLAALALEGEWPSLADVSLLSHGEWPAGEARYLLGGAFVEYLVGRYGWDSMLASLRQANAGWHLTSYAEAWRRVTGDDLTRLWREWQQELAQHHRGRVAAERRAPARLLTSGGRSSSVLAIDPTGSRMAWRPAAGPGLLVATLGAEALPFGSSAQTLAGDEGSSLTGVFQALPRHLRPLSLTWAGPDTLVYSRAVREPDALFVDLFELDLTNGRETRLTRRGRARFPRTAPEGCVLYVNDEVTGASELRRVCRAAESQLVFRAPAGMHVVGLAVSGEGRIALSIWRRGFVDLALLEGGRLDWLTQDASQDLDPWWAGEDELVFRSDRGEVFELYATRPGEPELRKLTSSLGGAFSPSAASGLVAYARLGGRGYDVALAPLERTLDRLPLEAEPLPSVPRFSENHPVREYRPGASLVPFGWLPELGLVSLAPFRLAGSATVLGQDRSGEHSYALTAGYHPELSGPAGGGWFNIRYDYRSVDLFDLFQRSPPLAFGVRVGTWPHSPHLAGTTEITTGGMANLLLRSPLGSWTGLVRLQGGLVHLGSGGGIQPEARVDALVSRRYVDLWGYGTGGSRLSLHGVWSATAGGGSAGAWLNGSSASATGASPSTVEFSLLAGYRPLPPVPTSPPAWALYGTLSLREHVPIAWRLADALVAVERATIEGRLHGWYDDGPGGGVDLSVWADAMLRYGAPVSVGATIGHAGTWWYRLGVRLPF